MTSQDFANQNNFNQVYDSSYLRDYLYKDYIQAGTGTSIDNSVVRWDGTDATTIQGTSVLLDDSNVFTIPTGDNLIFSGSGCITFTDTSGNTISIQGASGSIDFTQRLRLPATMGATGSVLAIENITGINYDLSWETDVLLISDGNTVDNSVVRWDGTSGSNVQDSNLIIDDSNNLIIPSGVNSNITFSGSGGVIFTEDGGANTYTIRGPSTLASDITLTLPNSIGTSGQLLQTDGSGNMSWTTVSSAQPTPVVPDWDFSNYTEAGLTEYLRMRSGFSEIATGSYDNSFNVGTYGYNGSVYSPTEDRVYFVPWNNATGGAGATSEWHYIDCSDGTGTLTEYDTGLAKTQFNFQAYAGGCYSPTQNRIYLVPQSQATIGSGANSEWHYIDCSDGSVVQYDTGFTKGFGGAFDQLAYDGGVYSPTQNRIYLVPYFQSDDSKWHYIDCSDGSVVDYTHGATVLEQGYSGGVYSPTQDRIYFIPNDQISQTNWHYIDCSDGSVVAYTHPGVTITTIGGGYSGGVYSPRQNRIYFVPSSFEATKPNWIYIDCDDGSVVEYAHGVSAVIGAYNGGVYSPIQNRIYFVPSRQASETNWHYIDCSDGSVNAYAHNMGSTIQGALAYAGGIYAPTLNRIYFTPSLQATNTTWHYITDPDETTAPKPATILMAGALFNKY